MKLNQKDNFFSTYNLDKKRAYLIILSFIISIIVLIPIISLVFEGIIAVSNRSINLGIDGLIQVRGTLILLILTSIIGGIMGTTNGWLLANCRFPGRKILRASQLLPLATPAYLLSATLIDLGSIFSIRIYGMLWAVIVMAVSTYPYVFLLSTESFSISGKKQLEACRSLGVGPWESFQRIALPIAIPSIGAGIALMGMEVINELGAVQLLNVPSISAGILEKWSSEGNPSGAICLALIALAIVASLLVYEKSLRRRSKRWTEGVAGGESPTWELKGIRAVLAQLIAIVPPTFALGTPMLWAIVNIEQIHKGLNFELFLLSLRTLMLGIAAAIICVIASLLLSISKRWYETKWIKSLTFIAGIGYAVPGAVIALALISVGVSLSLPSILLLLWGYCVRFLAVSKGGMDAAFERISPSIDEAAMILGNKWPAVLRRIHIPLLKGPIAVGSLLVFVDTIKELPLTFVLRPFDFDTLSVRVFQYASDERLGESILPAIIILSLGLVSSFLLIRGLEYKDNLVKNEDIK